MIVESSRRYWSAYLLGAATMLVAGVLWLGLTSPPQAYAQVPDSGAQRNQMIVQMITTNQKLTEIADLLKEIRDLNKRPPEAQKPAKPGGTRP